MLRAWSKSLVLLAALAAASTAWADSNPTGPRGVLIRIAADGRPEVMPLYRISRETSASPGMLIWSDGQRESWQVLPTRYRVDRPLELALGSRSGPVSRGEASDAGGAASFPTVPLDQLVGQTVVRGAGFLTPPHGGYCLDPRLTIRRQPDGSAEAYPAATLVLKQGSRILARVAVREGQATITWPEIAGLPAEFSAGLPAGEYTLVTEDGRQSTTFFVEDPEIRDWVMELPAEMEQLLGGRADPLWLEVAVGHLLGQTDERGRPRPYPGDALDLIEQAPATVITPHLSDVRIRLLARLEGRAVDRNDAADATGISAIDAARRHIVAGQWDEALAALDTLAADSSPRTKGLATLYRAVVLAESGPAVESEARALFARAVVMLQPYQADAYRAHNNYANFLLARCQDRLYNQAFQIASGVRSPVVQSLMDWRDSLIQYRAALRLSERLGPAERPAVEANLARLYALLGDAIRTLDPPVNGQRGFAAGDRQASAEAQRLARQALAGEATDLVRAAAAEVLAHLAFREEDSETCAKHARESEEAYLRCGSLAGVESVHRLLGLMFLRRQPTESGARAEALRHLRIARLLAEFLRSQVPADRLGLGRAGFFARRAYVYERIGELLIDDNRPLDALEYLELAKARGLQDVLSTGATSAVAQQPPTRRLSEIVSDWPGDVAAVEYYLGAERAWVFCVATSGEVGVRLLQDGRGQPVPPAGLVARVRSFLSNTDHQAVKMRQRLEADLGFDSAWQDELHRFCQELLPPAVLAELRRAKTVIVVPHHILHYFPLASLVTEPDPRATSAVMAKPRFLIDEPYDLCYAPSLTAWDLLREQPNRPIQQVNASAIVHFPNAPPLPGVEQDIANLRTTLSAHLQTILTSQEALEGRARSLFDRRGLLFLATHGQNLADNPLASYLLFRPDGENDGFLTAREIYETDVAADLVVLSACYSGLADRSPLPGDDLFGIQRALIHSGARTVVAGLWDVYDGTGPIVMGEFFTQLAAGRPAHTALAGSQRALLARLRASDEVEPWLHPYFWAVYTAIGDDRTHFAPAGK